jgi:THO complex subunit 2
MVLLDDERFLKQGGDEEDPVDRQSRAKALWRECLAIIGWYDLSPQRIVDLLLDAFCQRIATHWRFYLDVLEVSPWAKRNTTPSGTTADEPEDGSGPLADIDTEVNIPSTVTTEFMSQVNSETGNKILTQTLGFKFAFHQYHNGDLKGVEEDPTDAPKELLYMTAILIRQGFIRTLDILPYLSLDDAGMDGLLRAYKTKTQQDIRNLGGNALLMAAALPDDDAPKGSNSVDAETEASKPRKDLAIQKIQLCEALLAIGHLQPAFYIISRWPVIAQYSEQVALLIMRIVEYALQPACDALEVLQNADIPTLSQNYRTHFQFSDPEQIATLYCPEPLDTEKQQYKFFFKEWSTKLERWASPEEVVAKAQPFMRIVGARAAANVNVLISLCRIGVYHMTIDVSQTRMNHCAP